MALDKQKHYMQKIQANVKNPENVPRLIDLIKPAEDRFAVAFYHGVRDTLVADDLDQASRLAYGETRRRVVTLQGQLFETSGTLSGGGSRPRSGAMRGHRVKGASSACQPEIRPRCRRGGSGRFCRTDVGTATISGRGQL